MRESIEGTESVQKLEIPIHPGMSRFNVQQMLGAWADRQEAEARLMSRLARRDKTKGENVHRHIAGRRGGMGTVDVTYSSSSGRLTISVHDKDGGSGQEKPTKI